MWGGAIAAALMALWAARTGPWSSLRESGRLNLWLGMAVILMLVWQMKAGVYAGLNLHLLGAMVANLVFGPQLAMVLLGATLAGVTLNGATGWASFPLNWLAMAVWPVVVAEAIRWGVMRYMARHFFVYVFVIAFFGSAVAVVAQGAMASLVLVLSGAYSLDFLLANYLPYFLLLGFAEAWLSGGAVTLMVIYRPGWVASFDDRMYLQNK